jgi:ribonuclease P protein component
MPAAHAPGEERPKVGARGVERSLTRRQRLTASRLFQDTFEQGRSFAGALMVLWLRAAPDAAQRLGVVASKRSFARAVDRSRVKRLLREAYRLNRVRFVGPQDVVLVARRPLLRASRQEAERDLLRLAARAGLTER